jgi:hypothetical protein
MTYTLFECLKDKLNELVVDEDFTESQEVTKVCDKIEKSDDESKQQKRDAAPKKEQLTKAQKRRQWDRLDAKGNKPRGWDWVDIVKHLSQTANKD